MQIASLRLLPVSAALLALAVRLVELHPKPPRRSHRKTLADADEAKRVETHP